jgi:uncharacterized protein
MAKKTSSLRCPTCRTIVTKDDEHFPFCSDRCRLIDLGKWASGAYKVSSPILDPEVLEDIDQQKLRKAVDDDDDSKVQ